MRLTWWGDLGSLSWYCEAARSALYLCWWDTYDLLIACINQAASRKHSGLEPTTMRYASSGNPRVKRLENAHLTLQRSIFPWLLLSESACPWRLADHLNQLHALPKSATWRLPSDAVTAFSKWPSCKLNGIAPAWLLRLIEERCCVLYDQALWTGAFGWPCFAINHNRRRAWRRIWWDKALWSWLMHRGSKSRIHSRFPPEDSAAAGKTPSSTNFPGTVQTYDPLLRTSQLFALLTTVISPMASWLLIVISQGLLLPLKATTSLAGLPSIASQEQEMPGSLMTNEHPSCFKYAWSTGTIRIGSNAFSSACAWSGSDILTILENLSWLVFLLWNF